MFEIIYLIFMILFLFGITIFVHEWGHFIVARKCGLKVEAFAIGMGPALIKKTVDEVEYKLCLFPIGGYVSLPQLDPSGMEKLQGNTDGKNNIEDVSPWKKILVAIAGPLCNVIFAILLGLIVSFGDHPENPAVIGKIESDCKAFSLGLKSGDKIVKVNNNEVNSWYDVQVESILSSNDKVDFHIQRSDNEILIKNIEVNNPEKSANFITGVYEAIPCVIGGIIKNSPAQYAGLKEKDVIKRLNGIAINDWYHFTEIVQKFPNKNVSIEVTRDNKVFKTYLTPKLDNDSNRVMIGIKLGGAASMPWTLYGNPFEQIKKDSDAIFRLLKALTTKDEASQAAKGLGGPVAIFSMIWIALKMGIINALALMRFININLAILNMLPIPVLDGGHIIFSLFEGITRKKIPAKFISFLVNIFALLLISAMVWLSVRDVQRVTNINKKSSDSTNQVENIVTE
jgi:regulator of sigma E protease